MGKHVTVTKVMVGGLRVKEVNYYSGASVSFMKTKLYEGENNYALNSAKSTIFQGFSKSIQNIPCHILQKIDPTFLYEIFS